MSFFEVEFPRKIGFSSSGGGSTPVGGPGWSTIVNMGFSGFEQRNRNWASVRNKYQLDLVAMPYSVYQDLLAFFLAVGGKADGFRFLDKSDYQMFAQPMLNTVSGLTVGDGVTKIFQLQKQYTIGSGVTARTYTRNICKPIQSLTMPSGAPITDFIGNVLPNTVKAYVNGINSNNYTIDATTGLVTFNSAPANGFPVTADAQFHIPVRFDVDDLPANVIESDLSYVTTQASNSTDLANKSTPLVSLVGVQLVELRILQGQSQG